VKIQIPDITPKTFAAQLFSYLFHPLLLPTYGIFLLLNSGTHLDLLIPAFKDAIYVVVIICTMVLPISLLPLFRYFNIVESIYMSSNRERIFPLLITAVFFYVGYYFLLQLRYVPSTITSFMFGSCLSVALALLVTVRWKISAHLVGIGGVCGAIVALFLLFGIEIRPMLLILIAITAAVASSRLYLNEHNPLQVYSGFFLGFATVITSMLLF